MLCHIVTREPFFLQLMAVGLHGDAGENAEMEHDRDTASATDQSQLDGGNTVKETTLRLVHVSIWAIIHYIVILNTP